MTKKKILVKTKSQLDFYKSNLTKADFDARFEMTPELLTTLTAESMIKNLAITDRVMTAEEYKIQFCN